MSLDRSVALAAANAADPYGLLRQPSPEQRQSAALRSVKVPESPLTISDLSYRSRYFQELAQDSPPDRPVPALVMFPELDVESASRLDAAIKDDYTVFARAYISPEDPTKSQVPLSPRASEIVAQYVSLGRDLYFRSPPEVHAPAPVEYLDAIKAYSADPTTENLAIVLAVELPKHSASPLLNSLIPEGLDSATLENVFLDFDETDPDVEPLRTAMSEALSFFPANLFTEVDRPFRPRLRGGVRFSYDPRLREASIPSPDLHHAAHAIVHYLEGLHPSLRIAQYAFLSVTSDLPMEFRQSVVEKQKLNQINPLFGRYELTVGDYAGRLPSASPNSDDRYEVLGDTVVRWALHHPVPLDQECFTAGLIYALAESLRDSDAS